LGGQVFWGRPNWHIEDPTKSTKQQSSLNFGATENDTGQVFEVLLFLNPSLFKVLLVLFQNYVTINDLLSDSICMFQYVSNKKHTP